MKICIITFNKIQKDDRLYYKLGRSLAKIADILILSPTFATYPGNPQLIGMSNHNTTKYEKYLWFIETLKIEQPDIIHVTHPWLLMIAGKIKQFFGTKIVYDPAEDWQGMVRELSHSSWIIKQLIAYSMQGIEVLYRREIDLIIASDKWLYSNYKNKGKTLLLYNYPNLNLFSNNKSNRDSKIIVYHGQMIRERGIFDLINAVSILIKTHSNISLELIGHFPNDLERIEAHELIDKKMLNKHVHFHELVDHSQIPSMLANAIIGVSPLHPIKKFQRNIPTKVFEYMASGLSIIASDLSPIRGLKYSNEWCTFYKAGDVNGLAEAMIHILNSNNNNPIAHRLFKEEFNWEAQEAELLLQYRSLLEL